MMPDLQHAFELASGPDGAARVFAYVADGLRRDVGSLLTTASVYDFTQMRTRRVYTDDPAAYPLGNFKRLDRNRYFEVVIEGGAVHAATTIEQIAEVFFDWRKIRDLGCESCLNLPAIVDGRVIGTINLLHRKGRYVPDRVQAALAWQPVTTLAFLLLLAGATDTASFHGKQSGIDAALAGLEG